jgi:hypothetical protein
MVEKKKFYNCQISIGRTTHFTDCHFDNCYIEALIPDGINLSGCELKSCSIQSAKIVENDINSFDKCCILLNMRWYPRSLRSFYFSFTKYMELLRKYREEQAVVYHDWWYYDSVADLEKIHERYKRGEGIKPWVGPIKFLWGDESEAYLLRCDKAMPEEAAFLRAIDKWFSRNIVYASTYKNIIHDWPSENRK